MILRNNKIFITRNNHSHYFSKLRVGGRIIVHIPNPVLKTVLPKYYYQIFMQAKIVYETLTIPFGSHSQMQKGDNALEEAHSSISYNLPMAKAQIPFFKAV